MTEHWRGLVFFAGLGLMLGAETSRPARPWETPRLDRLLFHSALAALNILLLRLACAAPLLALTLWVRGRGWGLSGVVGLAGPVQFILLDLLDYWWHRLNHVAPFLWRFHKVHHVDTHVDATTSLRFHPGELLLSAFMKALWILALGPSVMALAVFEAATTLAAQFHHSNIDLPGSLEGALRRLIVTPRFHASHHTVKTRTREANFSVIFILWDKLFGSYREPDSRELRELGLPKGRRTYLSWPATLLGPFKTDY